MILMKDDIKVFVLPSWYPPHGGNFFQEQISTLNEVLGQVVLYAHPILINDLFCSPIKYVKQIFRKEVSKTDGFTVIRMYYPHIPKFFRLNLFIQNLVFKNLYSYGLKRFGKPVFLHAHSSIWAGWSAYKLSKIHNIDYIITEHRGRFVDNQFAKQQKMLPKKFDKYLSKIFSNASQILTVSSSLKTKIQFYVSNKNLKVKTIPNLINDELFYKTIASNASREEKFKFITVCSLKKNKAINILIEAFKDVSKKTNSKLIVVGDGPERNKLEKLSEYLGLSDQISFLGWKNRSEVQKLIFESHVFVLPTKYEAFGVVYGEALMSGIPSIGTRGSGGPEDIIEHGKNGFLVEVDNIKELTYFMIKAFEDYDLFNKNDIKLHALEKFGKNTFQKNYRKIFNEIIGKRK